MKLLTILFLLAALNCAGQTTIFITDKKDTVIITQKTITVNDVVIKPYVPPIIVIPPSATNKFYISTSGNDANAGTSPATAWKTIAKVNGRTFLPTDSILFNRGNMWREQLTIPSSNITFGAYGTGAKPIINGADIITTGWTLASPNVWTVINPNATNVRAMVVVDDTIYSEATSIADVNAPKKYFISAGKVYVYSITNPATRKSEISKRDYCIITASGSNSKKSIEVCDIEVRYAGRAGIYFEGAGASPTNSFDGSSIVRRCLAYANRSFGMAHVDHYDNVLFEDCEAYYNGNGLYSWVADEGTFRRCITANQIHYEYSSGFTDGGGVQGYQADNWTAEYCVSNKDYDAIHLDCGGVACHGTIRYNKIYDSRAGNPNTPCMGVGTLGVGGHIDIYYNLMVNGASAACESYSIMSDTVNFYNNTCYQSATTGTDGILSNHKSGVNWQIKNNIFVRQYALYKYNMINVGLLPISLDNNLYFIYGGGGLIRNWYNTAYTTLAAWRTATGKEANSISADPLFVNVLSDWSLQATSPCINKGVNVGLTRDILGNSIVGLPDIGCYEK